MQVLVIDDSAVARTVLTRLLGEEKDLEVLIAPDALIAQKKVERHLPDVILLDLEMPRMGGLEFLEWLMERYPTPVIVLSAIASEGSRAALEALDLGAIGIVAKPRLSVREYLEDAREELLELIRGASGAKLKRGSPRASVETGVHDRETPHRLVAIGASTGGPDAIQTVLEGLPSDAPPILVVQHMPAPFTRYFAARLNDRLPLEVREALEGDRPVEGRVYIAPGDRHMEVSGGRIVLKDGRPVSRHKPSIDVMLWSVAREVGAGATAVLLTGMGEDGASGMAAIRDAGGTTIVQDESSSVVFGMAAKAIDRGAVHFVEPLEQISRRILALSSPSAVGRLVDRR